MSCQHCVNAVQKALEALPGVESAAVDLHMGRATVRGNGITRDGLVKAVEDEGYTAQVEEAVEGKS